MIEFDPKVSGIQTPYTPPNKAGSTAGQAGKSGFARAVSDYVSQVDELNKTSDAEVKDLLAGKSQDINSVVMAAAKADASFKLLVGVRNKLIEAYKQTMNMQI